MGKLEAFYVQLISTWDSSKLKILWQWLLSFRVSCFEFFSGNLRKSTTSFVCDNSCRLCTWCINCVHTKSFYSNPDSPRELSQLPKSGFLYLLGNLAASLCTLLPQNNYLKGILHPHVILFLFDFLFDLDVKKMEMVGGGGGGRERSVLGLFYHKYLLPHNCRFIMLIKLI